MFVGLNYLRATSLNQVKEQEKMEIQLQKIEEEWKKSEKKCLEATTSLQLAVKKLETMKKEQLEAEILWQKADRNWTVVQKNCIHIG